LKKEVYPLNMGIEDAFDRSNILVVEANINDINKIDLQKFMENVFYQGNDSLEKHVSPETYELVKAEFKGLGIPPELINKQKPWFLALTLTSLELLKLGFDPNYGIDRHFLSKADGTKKTLELESLDFQLNLFSTFSDREQELFLLYTTKNLSVLEQESDGLVSTWQSGDLNGMESIISKGLLEDSDISSLYEKLLYERNRNMTSKIEEFLSTGETYFVVVGAGHLVGKKGILEILKSKGYPVEQL
jgi:uncharacterized protein YbaP (TraB family)